VIQSLSLLLMAATRSAQRSKATHD